MARLPGEHPPADPWALDFWPQAGLWSGVGGTRSVELSSRTLYSPHPRKPNLASCLFSCLPGDRFWGGVEGDICECSLSQFCVLSRGTQPLGTDCFSTASSPVRRVPRGSEDRLDHRREGDRGMQWAQRALAFLLGMSCRLVAASAGSWHPTPYSPVPPPGGEHTVRGNGSDGLWDRRLPPAWQSPVAILLCFAHKAGSSLSHPGKAS